MNIYKIYQICFYEINNSEISLYLFSLSKSKSKIVDLIILKFYNCILIFMSLLNQLLQYSSLGSDQITTDPYKKPRSHSICDQFYTQPKQNEKYNKINSGNSKSVSKIQHTAYKIDVDPKTRMLLRLNLKFGIKFRKYYYQFFVKLSNMKKKNIWMSQQISNSENCKINKQGLIRLQDTIESAYSKIYSYQYKELAFSLIQKQAIRNHSIRIIANICEMKYAKDKSKQFFEKLYEYEKQHLKFSIFIQAIEHLLQFSTYSQQLKNQNLMWAYQKIRSTQNQNQKSINKNQSKSIANNSSLNTSITFPAQKLIIVKSSTPLKLFQNEQTFHKTNQIRYQCNRAITRALNCQQPCLENSFQKESIPPQLTKIQPDLLRNDPGDFCDHFEIFVDQMDICGYKKRAYSQTNQAKSNTSSWKNNIGVNFSYGDFNKSLVSRDPILYSRATNPEIIPYTSYKNVKIQQQEINRSFVPCFHQTYSERKQKKTRSLLEFKQKVILTNRQFKVIESSQLTPTKDPIRIEKIEQRGSSSNYTTKTNLYQYRRQYPITKKNPVKDFNYWNESQYQIEQLPIVFLGNKNKKFPKNLTDRQKKQSKHYMHF